MCRFVQLPEGFSFPVTQILGMWSLFAKYEGLDEEEGVYKYTAPTIVDKKYQVMLHFGKEDKKLKKVLYNGMPFKVETFDSCNER